MRGYFLLLLLMYSLLEEGNMTEMEEVEELLNMESAIDLKNSEGLILLIGSSGTGKSTLAKFLTNDPSLQIVQSGKNGFVFKDNGTISNNIRKSMTLLPNVYQDPQTNEVIVDCPGFSDTREPKYEIANAFFIKKVLEYPQKLKIIVTENHFSLLEGSDRFGFSRLLLALAELIPNIEDYQESIAFVSTKASLRGISPEDVKSELLQFLANYKIYLEEDLNSKANNTVQGMIKVLDVLTGHPRGKNIAFFWQPTITKTQSIEDMMTNCKNNIRSILFNKLTWANNTNAVYHYSLSKESRLFIRHELAPSNLESTHDELLSFFTNFKLGAKTNMLSFSAAKDMVKFIKGLQSELSSVSNITLMSVRDISNVTQRLAVVTDTEDFNEDVLYNLASKAEFFKSFGVDVVQQLNKVMHKQLKSMQLWMFENLQNAIRLQEVQEQTEDAKVALENASKAAKEAEERNAAALAEVNRAMLQTGQDTAIRVAAAESAKKVAEENAERADRDFKSSMARMEEMSKKAQEILQGMASSNKQSSDMSIAGLVLSSLGLVVGAASIFG